MSISLESALTFSEKQGWNVHTYSWKPNYILDNLGMINSIIIVVFTSSNALEIFLFLTMYNLITTISYYILKTKYHLEIK